MRYEASVVIDRPIDEVWAFTTDLFNAPRFSTTTLAARLTSPGPLGLGSTAEARVVILGFEARGSAVVTEWDPPHYTFAASGKGAGMRSGSFRGTLEATADGTKYVSVIELEPEPTLKLLWWIFGPWFRRRWDANVRNMKRLLEAGRG